MMSSSIMLNIQGEKANVQGEKANVQGERRVHHLSKGCPMQLLFKQVGWIVVILVKVPFPRLTRIKNSHIT
jgi:hypothetical protein